MKDVVFLVVDSLIESYVMHNEFRNTTPFMDSISNKCIRFDNVYSQGPFTEAGTLGLLTATNTLHDCNYLFRYDNSKKFITEIFKNEGFETYSLIYPTCLYSDRVLKTVDHTYYTAGMLFDVFWNQKFSYFIELQKTNKFDDLDKKVCVRLLKIIFEAWLNYLDPNNDEGRELLEKYDFEDVNRDYLIVSEEHQKFLNDPENYTVQFLYLNGESPLNKLANDFSRKIIKNDAIKEAFSKNQDFIRNYKKNQFWKNAFHNRVFFSSMDDMPKRIKNGIDKYTFGEWAYYAELLMRGNDIKTFQTGHDYKLLLSANTQISKIAEILSEDHTTPRFITAHVEEPHYFTTFFSFDNDNVDLIDSELKYANKYINSIPKNYKGLLSYDLAVRYIDKQVEMLFNKLKESNRLDNTVVVVTADHGSSYNMVPPRNRTVNNCHSENYHIPFVIYDSMVDGRIINVLSSNNNIIPTLLDYMGLDYSSLNGSSLLRNECVGEFITTEYMGSGCPDMRRKSACINVRSNRYLLAYEGNILQEFSEENIYAIYDLLNDKNEVHNIKKTRNDEINRMIQFLEERITNIKKNNKEWLQIGV